MDVCAVALAAVARLIDQTTWRRVGRLWIPPIPLEIEDIREVDLGSGIPGCHPRTSRSCSPPRVRPSSGRAVH